MDKREMFEKLSKLDPKTIKTLTKKWKDRKTGEDKAMSQKYITARTVMNMLDRYVGPENWRAEYAPMNLNPTVIAVQCTLYLRIDGEWVGKTDIGTASDIEPEKGAVSDAFKRAAVHWGIGRELYNEGTATFEDDDDPTPKPEPEAVHDRARTMEEPPAEDSDSPLDEVTWTRDETTVKKFVNAAQAYWEKEHGETLDYAHLYNRIAVVLDLSRAKAGTLKALSALIAAEYTGSKDDAWAAVRAYVPAAK